MTPDLRVAAVVVWLVPAAVFAELRSGENVVVGPGEVVEGNLYAAGQTVSVQGRVTGDVVAAGNTVEVSGKVGGDVLALGGTVSVSGEVKGSVRAGAGQLNLAGPVGEDAVVAGGQLQLARSAPIGGDLLAAGGEVGVNAPVGGEVWAAASELALRGPVEGDVHARVGELRVAEGARIGGDLSYQSDRGAQISPGASVGGAVSREGEPVRAGRRTGLALLFWVRSLVALFGLGLLVVLAFPSFTRRSIAALRSKPGLSFGYGVAGVFGTPLVAVMVFAIGLLIGGWWLAMLLLGIYAAALAVCFPVVAAFIGQWLLERLKKPGVSTVVALLVGVVILTLLIRVPLLGALVALATMLFGLGAMIVGSAQRRGAAPAA